MSEQWKKIPDFELYEISNLGKVRTDRPLIHGRGENAQVKHLGYREIKQVYINGYNAVCLRGETGSNIKKTHYVHRLLWQMFVGEIPQGYEIDHINRNRADCRLENLRLATVAQNQVNNSPKENKSGFRGVVKDNRPGRTRYRAFIRANKKKIQIGSYKTKEEAAIAYDEAAKRYHGEFANLNFIEA
jgi:hypothetical protein